MVMHVLGIMGSPRAGGSADRLLDEALAGAVEAGAAVEKVAVSMLRVSGCTECDACADNGLCSISDDMDELYDKLMDSDAVIVSAPIFFYALPAQLKAVIDRTQALWQRKYRLGIEPPAGRKGLFLSVSGGEGSKVFDGALLTMRYFFDALGIGSFERLLFRGSDAGRERGGFQEALQEARRMGRALSGEKTEEKG